MLTRFKTDEAVRLVPLEVGLLTRLVSQLGNFHHLVCIHMIFVTNWFDPFPKAFEDDETVTDHQEVHVDLQIILVEMV